MKTIKRYLLLLLMLPSLAWGGLQLNGSSQYGTIALTTSFPAKPYTVAIWAKNDNAPVAANEYAWCANDDTLTGGEAIGGTARATGTVIGGLDEGGTTFTIPTTTNTYSSATWHLILVIYTSSTSRRVVLDGDWANSGTNSTDVGTEIAWDDILVGAYQGSGGSVTGHWDGTLAGFAIWDVAFSESDSDTLWNSGTPREPNKTRPADIIQYNEMYDDGVATTGDNISLTGSPSYSTIDHPYTPSASNVPAAFQHYRRRRG